MKKPCVENKEGAEKREEERLSGDSDLSVKDRKRMSWAGGGKDGPTEGSHGQGQGRVIFISMSQARMELSKHYRDCSDMPCLLCPALSCPNL